MTPITSPTEFLGYVPELVKLFSRLDGAWEPGATKDEFITRLLTLFQNGTAIFLRWSPEHHDFDYVVTLEKTNELGFINLFYVGKHYRAHTKEVLNDLRAFGKSFGITKVRWLSTILTCSYRRWVAKQGAEPVAIMYQTEV